MRNKKLFQRTKASNQEFRILADEDLDYVSGGTDSLESEESSEETPEVQSDSSDSGSSEEKLEDLASQAVAAAEAPAEIQTESAPIEIQGENIVESVPVENPVEIPSSNAMNNAMANLEASNKVQSSLSGQESEFKIAERIESQIESLNQANYNAQSGREMMKVPEGQLSSTDDVLRTLKDKMINAVNDTNTEVDRNAVQKEITVSVEQLTANQRICLPKEDMRNERFGLSGKESTVHVTEETKSTAGLKVIDTAYQRPLPASIEATMNRLEFTSSNLTTASENLQSPDSTYSDADMAKEMTELTKNNILNQAATAMLQQANQQNQGVLQLLQ